MDIDSNLSLTASSATVLIQGSLHDTTPATLTVHYADTDFDQVFTYSEEFGCYLDEDNNELYVEPGEGGFAGSDSYFEVPEAI